ncbi:MAG: hypothetical protein KGY38_07735 [Desulfobacterales bacterium]|nr:hypothetical protein [Desulfobacterales bacterium]
MSPGILFFFTGAGISTESGMFDYRVPDGVWTRQESDSTPFDSRAPLRFTEQVGEVMHRTVKQLKGLIAYFLLNTAYSYYLKHIAVVDIVCVAVSYVLRAFAGAVVITVFPSNWLILMTFLLALFLALAKRRDDLLLAQSGKNTRKCIEHYNFEFISGEMMVMASVTIVSYLLYTVSPEVIAKHGTDNLYFTVFWVILGFLRYMQLTFVEEKSGSPTQVVLRDTFLQTDSIARVWDRSKSSATIITC